MELVAEGPGQEKAKVEILDKIKCEFERSVHAGSRYTEHSKLAVHDPRHA